jgi:DNA polymerase-3 subunit chi
VTEVAFYTNVSDATNLVGRLILKAQKLGRKLHVSGLDETHCKSVTEDLHRLEPTSFFGIASSTHLEKHDLTSVVISHVSDYSHHDIIINLTTKVPDRFSTFQRIIEIVSKDDEQIRAARERYRWYKNRGYSIETYKM